MKNVGIICEYNPIHAGHKRQIDYARSMGAENIICVMSGNYTQRGEMTICDKYTRAECAIAMGADIVFELPFPFCSMSAEFFARAAIHILGSIGVDTVCFGHECEDISTLLRASKIFDSPQFKESLSQKNEKGSAKGFFDAYAASSNDTHFLGSNDILGAYYILAIEKYFPHMDILPLRRVGDAYRCESICDARYPSAMAIRGVIKDGGDISDLVPPKAMQILSSASDKGIFPVSDSAVSYPALLYFRMTSAADISSRAISLSCGGSGVLDDGGIVSRLCDSSLVSSSLYDLLTNANTKKYTHSRTRRVLLFSLFGVSDRFKELLPDYTCLLACSASGRAYLSKIRKTCNFEIVTKPSRVPRNSQSARATKTSDIFYAAAMGKNIPPSYFSLRAPFIADHSE